MVDQLAVSTDFGGHDGKPRGECFEDHVGERLPPRRADEARGRPVERHFLTSRHHPEKVHPVAAPEFLGEAAERSFLGARAGEQQVRASGR